MKDEADRGTGERVSSKSLRQDVLRDTVSPREQ